ncbi:MAG: flagellar biosynthetic protein FliO [Lachnospiraceae bacterium]|jgi:flagellar biosynthetic protein FliO|nr:flagellar biosynthetic protein FliO [Lachnospiraceae bacterium]
MGALSVFNTVVGILGILLLAYWCSRMLGKKWGNSSCSGNIKVVGQLQVGQDRQILLLELGEHYYLVGVSQAGIQLLTEVEGDFETDMQGQPGGPEFPSFPELLEKYRKRRDEKDRWS